jgi:O-antigen/teichoic acid export membrane protein
LAGGLVGVAMAVSGYGAWSLVANLLVQNVVVTATIWRRAKFRVLLEFSGSHLKELWSFGQYTFLLRIAAFTANQGPRILVGYLFGASALGAFSLGLRIVEIMLQLLALPVSSVTTPVVARIRHDSQRLERAICSATQLTAMVSVPAFLFVALIAPSAVPLAFGAHWAQSVEIVQILALSCVFGACGMVYLGVLNGLGRPEINLAITTSAAVTTVALLLLMAHWGIVAATTAFVLRALFSAPMLVLLIARITGIRAAHLFHIYVPVLGAAIPMVVFVEGALRLFSTHLSPLNITLLAFVIGIASYGIGLLIFGRSALKLGVAILADLRPSQRPV